MTILETDNIAISNQFQEDNVIIMVHVSKCTRFLSAAAALKIDWLERTSQWEKRHEGPRADLEGAASSCKEHTHTHAHKCTHTHAGMHTHARMYAHTPTCAQTLHSYKHTLTRAPPLTHIAYKHTRMHHTQTHTYAYRYKLTNILIYCIIGRLCANGRQDRSLWYLRISI